MRTSKIIAGSSAIIVISSFLSFKLYKNEKKEEILKIDLSAIPKNQFGEEVRYGRELMLHTAYFIGPDGIKGKYLGNKMNCTNCHQDAGTKPFSFNLMRSHEQYPQYRAREGKVLTLAERVNNCIERPHNGKPLPLDSREMVALLSYLKWINGFVPKNKVFKGAKNLEISFPGRAASSERGSKLFEIHCQRCHGAEGEGKLQVDNMTYIYPPLWGEKAYQPGSSMHRIIKQAQWLKANMPFDKATWDKPFLSDEEALDIAAFVNDDNLHPRPGVKNFDYPHAEEKAIDYDRGPFVDSFTATQHKIGPYQPIISFWKSKGMNPVY
jgi:thiosulfate dehydrogenase